MPSALLFLWADFQKLGLLGFVSLSSITTGLCPKNLKSRAHSSTPPFYTKIGGGVAKKPAAAAFGGVASYHTDSRHL